MKEGSEDTVACPECGRQIWAHAEQCRRCGAWFPGEAWQQSRKRGSRDVLVKWTAIILLILLALMIVLGLW